MSYFSDDELRCQCGCGELVFNADVRDTLNVMREKLGFPLPVTSGYRCPQHPIEAAKVANGRPLGAHTTGRAVDVGVRGERAVRLIQSALEHGCVRIGVAQKGQEGRFVHLDWCDDRPTALWSY